MGGAPGYRVQITSRSYLAVTTFVHIGVEVQTLNITVPIDPKHVVRVEFPLYSGLPPDLRRLLEGSIKPSGFGTREPERYYYPMIDDHKAILLNITAKALATRLSNGRTVSSYFKRLSQIRSGRLVVEVDQDLMEEVDHSVSEKLFQSLRGGSPGFTAPPNYHTSGTFSTPDTYGRLQLTFLEPAWSNAQVRLPVLVSLISPPPAWIDHFR